MTHNSRNGDSVLRVMFVCTGNTCRSPMAEAIFRKLSSDLLGCHQANLRENGVDVFSAGVAAADHDPATVEAVEVMKRQGLDLSRHLSQSVQDEMLEQSNIILTMTTRHRDVLTNSRPDLSDRIKLLSRNGSEISDPYGMGIDAYANCAAELDLHLQNWVRELIQKKV